MESVRMSRFAILALIAFALAFAAAAPALAGAARPEVKAYEGAIEIPIYPWDPPVRHPYFRATDERNIYPYPMLDNLSRTKAPRTWRTVVLESDILRVTFLPELGGKIHEVLDKTTGKPVFYVNNVVKPGLIGQCGAWCSGGIEWNTGPAGHTVSAVQPIDVEVLPIAGDGARSVAVGERERIYGTRWTVVVTLRPGRSFLEERIRIYNPTDLVRPYYFWNCTAVPNTPGFRFVYPMTLGTDHGGNVFYTWPISEGKDLSRGTTYGDASSIFAYGCDQDFFGSYDEEADRGVVAFADHHRLPGKKAWTWGRGGFGTMHQMDLTDDDGPYNEVQTGPLLTQADVGRLDPSEFIEWEEWWYPVHGIGGFTFANRNLAANATAEEGGLRLRILGTGTWRNAEVRVLRGGEAVARAKAAISPRQPVDLKLPYPPPATPVEIEVAAGPPPAFMKKEPHPSQVLARFRVPLDLPVRTPPAKPKAPESASELTVAGWQDLLFARHPQAEARFRRALEKDPSDAGARAGLAQLRLDRDPRAASEEARAAIAANPDLGLARLALASASWRLGDLTTALDEAWAASLDPATAFPGRTLAAKVLLRRGDFRGAIQALSLRSPWEADLTARSLEAIARLRLGENQSAIHSAMLPITIDPLDPLARCVLWLAGSNHEEETFLRLVAGKTEPVLDLAATFAEIGAEDFALRVIEKLYVEKVPQKRRSPIPYYWAAWLLERAGKKELSEERLRTARDLSPDLIFPHRIETVPVLEWAAAKDPKDGKAALYLGHLLFRLGRLSEGRESWKRAAELGAAPAVAWRALGMAAKVLDKDPKAAAELFAKAAAADPSDPIVAMDLAKALLSLAEKGGPEEKKAAFGRVREVLEKAFESGKGRSDFVALLARARSGLGDFAATAKLLDEVRITIWEGAREAHDLFEEAHLVLGRAHLDAGRPAEALREFDRALEYPANLATGRLDGAREADIHELRGRALLALGKRAEAIEAYRKAAGEPESKDARKEEARRKAKEALEKLEKEPRPF